MNASRIDALKLRLHGEARLQLSLAKMEGLRIDKKIARFNEIVETALRYGHCGVEFSEHVVLSGLMDAIDCCIVGDPMHTPGQSCCSLVENWMLSAPDAADGATA